MRVVIYLSFLFLIPTIGHSQLNYHSASFVEKKPLIEIKNNVVKTGPYFGLQKGKYLAAEFGAERIWKIGGLLARQMHAAHMGFNYNFKYNVLGYDIGYWLKPNKFGLTYGANLFLRTDFDNSKLGVAPVLGFKVMWFHLQTGYHFMPRPELFETNTFFISLRFGIISDRDRDFDIKINRKKKKKRPRGRNR